jgi:uncharacterized membrane protein YgcG
VKCVTGWVLFQLGPEERRTDAPCTRPTGRLKVDLAASRAGRVVSSRIELVIVLAVFAAGWVFHVIRQVVRDRRRPSLDTSEAYDGNLVVPPRGTNRRGFFSARRVNSHGGGISGHAGHHHGPGGSHGQGSAGVGPGHH